MIERKNVERDDRLVDVEMIMDDRHYCGTEG